MLVAPHSQLALIAMPGTKNNDISLARQGLIVIRELLQFPSPEEDAGNGHYRNRDAA
jgi:hypothetical protein